MECTVAWKVRSQLGEGVWWDDRREGWFWLDIMTNELFFLKDGENRLLKTFDDAVGFCAPVRMAAWFLALVGLFFCMIPKTAMPGFC